MPNEPVEPRNVDERLRADAVFRLLVQSVKDYAILLLDPLGRVTSWNEGAERIKGWTADEILGRSFSAFYPPDAVAAGFPQYELDVASREGRFEDEGWRVRRDGSRFWANVVITALRDADGRVVGFAKVTRDLTSRMEAETQARRLAAEEAARAEAVRRGEELSRLNEELQTQSERLEEVNAKLESALSASEAAREEAQRAAAAVAEANRELDQFAYVASHDLKAPLRGIGNLAQWIEEDLGARLDAQSTEHMRLLQVRVHRMEALIDGILAYARAGRVLAKTETVDTGALVREVVELLAPPEGVRVEVQPGMPILRTERVPLQQVFMNLVGNAVKYAHVVRPDPSIRIGWRDTGDAYELAVSDDGPGIAPAYHERIWGLFQTLNARDRVEGTGIGLSVVKKIVEMRGGRAWVESSPGAGATFRFSWPKVPRRGAQP